MASSPGNSRSATSLLYCSQTTDLAFFCRGPTLTAANSDTGRTAIVYPSLPSSICAIGTNPDLNYVVQASMDGHVYCVASKTGILYW